jgi:methylenetetrahydrofolate reductase (NADPH)
MRGLGPEFIDITWYAAPSLLDTERLTDCMNRNAGGRTSDLTSEMVKTCQGLIGIETCMHLTCTNMPKEKVDNALAVRPPASFMSSHVFKPWLNLGRQRPWLP